MAEDSRTKLKAAIIGAGHFAYRVHIPTLAARPRWLVLNKTDLIDADLLAERRQALVEALGWEGPVYEISAISGEGTERLCQDMMILLEQQREAELADPDIAAAEAEQQAMMQQEARERIAELRARRKVAVADDDEEDDDDYDVEVEYAP